jgi:putative membrane protein
MAWYGMVFAPIMMIFWLVVVVVIGAAVIRWLQSGTVGPFPSLSGKSRALEILEERFAKGEIDKEEFLERKRLLSNGGSRRD